jgi:hypothetical protein
MCNGNHKCINCPYKYGYSEIYKKKAGKAIEKYVANNINCLDCKLYNLSVIGDHTPSLDIICINCKKRYEIKSKCLSVDIIPDDIVIKHGSYEKYISEINNGLSLILIIYSVNRRTNKITIKEGYYADNNKLNNDNIVAIHKNIETNSSTIIVRNKNELEKLNINKIEYRI